jgi:hypothetical protein
MAANLFLLIKVVLALSAVGGLVALSLRSRSAALRVKNKVANALAAGGFTDAIVIAVEYILRNNDVSEINSLKFAQRAIRTQRTVLEMILQEVDDDQRPAIDELLKIVAEEDEILRTKGFVSRVHGKPNQQLLARYRFLELEKRHLIGDIE